MIYEEPGSDDTAAARMINNEFDIGPALQPGVFEAARGRNPNLVSWNTRRSVLGCARRVSVHARPEHPLGTDG